MPLFEVAILSQPTKKEIEDEGKTEELIYGPVAVVAPDVNGAAIAAVTREGAQKFDINKVKVLIRPFA